MGSKGDGAQRGTRWRLRTIRASEIGEYSYCSRAWWYRHVARVAVPGGVDGGRLRAGREAHARHGRAVWAASRMRVVGWVLAGVGVAMLVLALVFVVGQI